MDKLPCATIRVLTFNVQHSSKCESDGATGKYSNFTWQERKKVALPFMARLFASVDVVLLQEVRDYNFCEIKKLLETQEPSFCVFEKEYGNRPDTAGHRDKLVVAARNLGTGAALKQDVECALLVAFGGIVIGSVHFPMGPEARMSVATQLGTFLSYQSAKLILGGDYNAFPDAGGHEQVHTLCAKASMYDATQFLMSNRTKRRACTTFRAYPWDSVPQLADQDKLDYVCVRRLVPTAAYCIDDMPTACVDDVSSFGPSDHFPVVVHLRECQ